MIKKLLSPLLIGLLIGLAVPQFSNAATPHLDINEDTDKVPAVETNPTYDQTPPAERICDGRTQVHQHFNISTDTNHRVFREAIHSFAIVLDTDYDSNTMPEVGVPAENDFLTNIDTTTMLCTDGNSTYRNCGFDKVIDLGHVIYSGPERNGTKITYKRLEWIDGNPRGLLWEYGQNNTSDLTLLPWLDSGENKLEAISFEPLDYEEAQTATTESWTKLEMFYYNPTTDNRSDLNTYHHVYPIPVDRNGDDIPDTNVDPDGDYILWYGLNATVRSLWNACPTETPTCARLDIDPTAFYVDDLFTKNPIAVTAYDTNGQDITNDVEYHYTSETFAGSGQTVGQFKYGPSGASAGRDVVTGDSTVKFTKLQPGDRLHVEVVGAEDVCYQDLEAPYCSDLTVQHNAHNVNASAEASNGEPWDFDITYSCPGGSFDGNTSPYSTTDSPVGYVCEAPNRVTVQADHDVYGYCSGGFRPRTDEVVCTDLTITEPAGGVVDPESFPLNVNVEMTGSDGQPWESDVTYESTDAQSTFDGHTEPYTTGSLGVSYNSLREATVTVSAVDDRDNVCYDSFTYTFTPVIEPVCADLNILTPRGGEINPDSMPLNIQVEMIDTNGDTWISDVTYDSTDSSSTFDGHSEPYTTSDLSVGYQSEQEATVTVSAIDDVNNVCFESFTYTFPGDDDDDDDNDDNDDNDDDDDDITGVVGNLSKYIFTFNFIYEKNQYSDEGVFFSHDQDYVFYTLEYEPDPKDTTVTFTDEMWTDAAGLRGYLGDRSESGGSVKLDTSLSPTEQAALGTYTYSSILKLGLTNDAEIGTDALGQYADDNNLNWIAYTKDYSLPQSDPNTYDIVYECEYDAEGVLASTDICFDPSTSPSAGQVVIENAGTLQSDEVVRIRYVGRVDSHLECDSAEDECLTEQFINTAYATGSNDETVEAEATLVVLCSYLVTRGAGDVYLEVQLEEGSDLSCIFVEEEENYRNVDALVILEAPTETVEEADTFTSGVYEPTVYSDVTISVCDNEEYDENLVGNLSSYVCEIVNTVSDLWKREVVEETQESQVSLSTRNVETNQGNQTSFNSWDSLYSALHNTNNPNSGILYYQGKGGDDTITISNIEVPEGAWTLIVTDATLKIASDIRYSNTFTAPNIPSIAFIVQGGDIYITTGAHQLVGVYYTDQNFTGDERSAVNDPLTFYGSIYGNIQPLLDVANYVGPATLDGAGIVVRYDSRIILNTPPGLSEYVDVSTEKGVN
ncbi:hypothetical protein KKC94_00185 [Patescibacteria group bacterium]|nr:hypothetical protein [Patescibacteria group bacterium]